MNPYRVHDRTPEYVDWISSSGKVMGQLEKYFSHLHGLLHPSVHIFVFDSKKRLILQYRSRTMTFFPSHWDTSVGGHVKAGENIQKGAQRELKEELGVIAPIHLLGWADVEERSKDFYHHERVHYYYSVLPAGKKITPNQEFDDVARISLNDMPAFVKKHTFTPTFMAGWKKFSKKLEQKITTKRK